NLEMQTWDCRDLRVLLRTRPSWMQDEWSRPLDDGSLAPDRAAANLEREDRQPTAELLSTRVRWRSRTERVAASAKYRPSRPAAVLSWRRSRDLPLRSSAEASGPPPN